ncbi:ArsR family transcriptional regulator [Clostridium pasteurianum DSM 525 = ATCC 6013]|uniref:ArsR family transcriptional regulator n=1 Tax=Clostridium pasteurianum DSM 525 = ATCC 6013 TaxID=1262449 RepID=A0A0H3J6P4_CLOPA|nr:metalloregulator ArsR/SmtB family transcription factor [Clostridium pasteurianum]AJA46630.1 ArsR family transcriptional regulator [Clostridium pasteurianum DSM 525 = ATCC 6013]AJA50618.1 ArsR family transcriptional regulator [Clostridium pasteurianum DSM 525 = ATCC 6013]AOZ74043.1 transcriptional regulator [Clostridium pasteurianum DSM 525 = ATCC 6013]AOZ77840.1 transcriptional regulator [Clostridium pasteurianum]ELP61196.1 ArsR family transcriptional regulator [Clostridium pasteurianum DSM
MNKDLSQFNDAAEILKILAHPVRLCIVKGLIENGGCNVSHMQECLGIPQSTVSQHLQKLKSAGIIRGMRNGLEIRYKVSNKKIAALLNTLFSED